VTNKFINRFWPFIFRTASNLYSPPTSSNMSFRKRNVVLASSGSTGSLPTDKDTATKNNAVSTPGIRPSPVDGRLTTSTGTQSLDTLLAGHAGFALGTSILLEEDGTTDFGGALLRYYAAEGIVQGHHVHVMGMSDAWGKELPGLSEGGSRGSGASKGIQSDKMKIAWRYERLGEFGRGQSFFILMVI
jgi:elongator complex protein 4